MSSTPPFPTPSLADEEARRRIREDLDVSLFVEAAAGTGKTTALIERILSVLRSGRGTLETIVAVTFTEKAAGEMKLRLREQIESSREKAPSKEELSFLEQALEQLEVSHINTIHGFCADLLREHPIEASIDPLFDVATDYEARRAAEEAFEQWFQQVLANPPEGVARLLRRRRQGPRGKSARDLLREASTRQQDLPSSSQPSGRVPPLSRPGERGPS